MRSCEGTGTVIRCLVGALVWAAVLASAGASRAQTRGNLLEGVNTIGLFVALAFEAEQCGIREDDLRSAFAEPLTAAGIEIRDSKIDIALAITVDSAMPKATDGTVYGCVSMIGVEGWTFTGYRKLRFNKRSLVTKAVIYSNKVKFVSPVAEHPANIARIVGEMSRKFVDDHSRDN